MFLSNTFTVKSPYTGKSKFDFWHNLKPGDQLKISLELKPPGYGRGLYATTLTVECNDEKFKDSLTGISNYLSKMELEPDE